MTDIPHLHVLVKFGSAVPNAVHGPALLAFERHLRELTGNGALWIEVFKETKSDDSKLRSLMTPEQRAKL